jgi:hypothetical protein
LQYAEQGMRSYDGAYYSNAKELGMSTMAPPPLVRDIPNGIPVPMEIVFNFPSEINEKVVNTSSLTFRSLPYILNSTVIGSVNQDTKVTVLGDLTAMIEQLKAEGREKEIQTAIQTYKEKNPVIPDDLAYLEGEDFNHYMHDMKLAQAFAKANREEIARAIIDNMGFEELDRFDTVHNYIDTENLILRKGVVSAQKGEQLIIPMNMRDGSILAVGKGNEDWNFSAPHGAGRVLSRTKAMKTLKMDDFHKTMEGVWTTSVYEETLDEAPMAYKPMNEILEKIEETSEIVTFIKPVYNFKASKKYIPGRYKILKG